MCELCIRAFNGGQTLFLQVENVRDLDVLKGLPVTEANFAGNPFTERYKDQDAYVRYRKRKVV